MRSHESTVLPAPLRPLVVKELWEITSGRALWTMLLLLCPLIGFSFFQAISLYSEASLAALQSPAAAQGVSPLDGIIVPSLGAFYVVVTLLFPFVAIRVLGQEKESGALRLLVQLPYRSATLIGAKLAAVFAAWLMSSVPALSVLIIWRMLGGHLAAPETLNLLFGHLLYGMLVGAIALFAASVSESAATAAIVTLAFTIGSWVLDFALAGRPGLLAWMSQLSLTQTLHVFEQGLLSAGLVLGTAAGIAGFAALAAVWLPPGVTVRAKVARSLGCVLVAGITLAIVTQLNASIDVTEDQRNSFPPADQRALATLPERLLITAHLAPEDPRYLDLQRSVLAKLGRVVPKLTIRLAGSRQDAGAHTDDDAYGEVEYDYGTRRDVSRSTSPREILPLIYGLARVPPPEPIAAAEYPGYPLVADAHVALLWFLLGLPLLIAAAWWRTRRAPRIDRMAFIKEVSHEHPS